MPREQIEQDLDVIEQDKHFYHDHETLEKYTVAREGGMRLLIPRFNHGDKVGEFRMFPDREVDSFEGLTPEEVCAMHRLISAAHAVGSKYLQKSDFKAYMMVGHQAGQSSPRCQVHLILNAEKQQSPEEVDFFIRSLGYIHKQKQQQSDKNAPSTLYREQDEVEITRQINALREVFVKELAG